MELVETHYWTQKWRIELSVRHFCVQRRNFVNKKESRSSTPN